MNQEIESQVNELYKVTGNDLYPVNTQDILPRMESARKVIVKASPLLKVWNRSHTDFQTRAFILEHEGEMRNLSQIMAELKKKRNALVEAEFALRKEQKEAEILRDEAEREPNPLKAELKILEAQEKEAYAQMKNEGIMGATKDIEVLGGEYDRIYQAMLEKHGRVDEEVAEIEERNYWIKRLMAQALADVRQYGVITKGEGMALERIGINPMEALKYIRVYVNTQNEELNQGKTLNMQSRESFLKTMVELFGKKVDEMMATKANKTDHLIKEKSDVC